MSSNPRGLLFIVSAPSGAGKTTLVERLVEQLPNLKMSRSYTSRRARDGEADGVDYNFVSREHFEAMIARGWRHRKMKRAPGNASRSSSTMSPYRGVLSRK